MTEITLKDAKQAAIDLEASILALCETYKEATGFEVSIIHTFIGVDGKRRVQVTWYCPNGGAA